MWCRNYRGSAVTETISPTADYSNMCAGSVMCLHRVHKGSRMMSSCVIFSSCFFLFLISWDSALFHFHHLPYLDPGDEVGGPLPRLHVDLDKGGFLFVFLISSTSVNVICHVLWSELFIQSDVFINHHYCVAHVGPMAQWCKDLTRPLSQQYQQIYPPHSTERITAICFDFCITFIFSY